MQHTGMTRFFLTIWQRSAIPDAGARFHVEIRDESAADRKQNVLRRLYVWMTGLLFFFRFVPTVANTFSEVSQVGAPGDIWDWITLLQPYPELILLTLLGYFIMLRVGAALTEKNRTFVEQRRETA